jgi:hypothetical protein
MKKFMCALAALLAAVLAVPSASVSAAGYPERAVVHDKAGDVRGIYPGKNSIDILSVSGTRVGGYLIGRMKVANVKPATDDPNAAQMFVLWVQTRGGVTYFTTAANAAMQEPPTKDNNVGSTFCAAEDVILQWGVRLDVVTFKIPMRCFKEHPVAWRVGGITFTGPNQRAWDQTGGKMGDSKLSPLFANTP